MASDGLTVAVSVDDSPSTRLNEDLLNATEVTGITFFSTVTTQVAFLPLQLAVIVVVPADRAVTLPLVTVATCALELAQVTFLSVASEGITVALSVEDSPSMSVRAV